MLSVSCVFTDGISMKRVFLQNKTLSKTIKCDESIAVLQTQLLQIIGKMRNVRSIESLLTFYGLDKIIMITEDEYFIYLIYNDTAFHLKIIRSSLNDISPLTLQSILNIYEKTDIYISSVYTTVKRLERYKNTDMVFYKKWLYSWHISVSMKMTADGAELMYTAKKHWTVYAIILFISSTLFLAFFTFNYFYNVREMLSKNKSS